MVFQLLLFQLLLFQLVLNQLVIFQLLLCQLLLFQSLLLQLLLLQLLLFQLVLFQLVLFQLVLFQSLLSQTVLLYPKYKINSTENKRDEICSHPFVQMSHRIINVTYCYFFATPELAVTNRLLFSPRHGKCRQEGNVQEPYFSAGVSSPSTNNAPVEELMGYFHVPYFLGVHQEWCTSRHCVDKRGYGEGAHRLPWKLLYGIQDL